MLKKIVPYENYNGEKREKELYFHLSKTEIIRMVSSGEIDPDKLIEVVETNRTKDLLSILLLLIDKSYGVKSSDGEFFTKNDELLSMFKSSPVYDSLVSDIVQDEKSAEEFFKGVFPAKELEEAMKTIQGRKGSKFIGQPPMISQFTEPVSPKNQYEEEIERLKAKLNYYESREVPADVIKTGSPNVGEVPGRTW